MERVEQPDRPVGKAVDLVQRRPLAVKPADQSPAALGTKVKHR